MHETYFLMGTMHYPQNFINNKISEWNVGLIVFADDSIFEYSFIINYIINIYNWRNNYNWANIKEVTVRTWKLTNIYLKLHTFYSQVAEKPLKKQDKSREEHSRKLNTLFAKPLHTSIYKHIVLIDLNTK